MAPTPSSRSNLSTTPSSKSHHSRTPFSKRLHFTKETTTTTPMDHPVEVITRIRNHTDVKTLSSLQINPDGKSLRLKTEIGYRDFSLDGVSSSEEDDIDGFYNRFVESRINGVKTGNKCTIMVYGPTGSGKSHTMFGCAKQPGIVYRSLKEILGEGDGERLGVGVFVQVTVLEIYNEEIYDLLPSGNVGGGGGGFGPGWPKGGSATKVKLEVMGKKAKNATFISGNEAGKILKEIQKVEKRRTVKSTLCNERSSRSHCMIIVDVPTVGGQLMLVDMAGSENIDQAGQTGLEAKLQTAKINQGNIALKRVVESIANGDSHVPFRDSKLTMLLQDSFEDDKSKILMILCASPDPKELHKTIATLEYGAKAKCIIRGAHTPTEDKGGEDSTSAVVLGSRIAALDQFICKLQLENKLKEKECNEALKKLKKKEEEVSILRAKLAVLEERGKEVSEDEINAQVNKRIQMMESEIERKIRERERINSEFVEIERKTMEERIFQQQQEIERLSRKLEENESDVHLSGGISASPEIGGSFMKRLRELSTEESDMVKSMDLDNSIDLDTNVVIHGVTSNFRDAIQSINGKACLTTVYEEEECENEEESDKENVLDEEVQKEVIEEETSSRELRIQNIFTLCGNYRELSQEKDTPMFASSHESSEPRKYVSDDLVVSDNLESWNNSGENKVKQLKDSTELASDLKENHIPFDEKTGSDIEIYVKWEASKENPGQFVTTLKVSKDSTLADLRKLVEIHLGGEQQGFTFLTLGDPSGAPVAKEKEAATKTSKLPICNNKTSGRLACLRPLQRPARVPFSSLENNLVTTTPNSHFLKKSDSFFSSPILSENLRSSPSVMVRSS